MPSTHKSRLSDFIKAFGRSATSNLDNIEVKHFITKLSASGTTSTPPVCFYAEGPCILKRVVFVPDTAVASNSTDKWVFTFTSKGTGGSGSTSLGTFSTYASDSATKNGALVAYDDVVAYEPTAEVELADGTVVALTATKSSSAADIAITVIAEYIALLA
jgi:hypothetical protein